MSKQAIDTFTADLKDGSQTLVTKGQVFPNNHPVVKHAPNLFVDLDLDDDPKPTRGRKVAS